MKAHKSGHRPDYFLIALVLMLTALGLVILASASSDLGKTQHNDSYFYLKHQLFTGLAVGLAGFFAGACVNYQRLKKLSLPLLVGSIALLALVFTPFGLSARNTSRWVRFGSLSFQPAELMKLTFIAYLAAWLSNAKANRAKGIFEGFVPLLLVSGVIALLLVLQPATSTVVILLGSGLVVYFVSGAPWKYVGGIVFLGMLGLAVIIYATPYRLQRIVSYLNKQGDAQGANYQLNQSLIAIGSGGLGGVGYGQSTSKIRYLPEPITDSIFAVAAEELGFVGAGGLVVLFMMLVLRLFYLARKVRDGFGRLLLIGFGAIIALQAFVNIAAISGLIPLTGVPLPFVSYGGTALAVFLTMSGIAVNVSKYTS